MMKSEGVSQCVSYMYMYNVHVVCMYMYVCVAVYLFVFRAVCEQLLRSLDVSNVMFWKEALSSVQSIVGGVDYKVNKLNQVDADAVDLCVCVYVCVCTYSMCVHEQW